MRIFSIKIFGIILTFAFLLSIILSAFAMFNVIRESGQGNASVICDGSVYLAFWPSILIKSKESESLFVFSSWVLNWFGWTIASGIIYFSFRWLIAWRSK